MITVRGRVPPDWNNFTASHITERLQALERALGAKNAVFSTPASATFGPGSGVIAGTAAGSTNTGGVATTAVTNVSLETWARKFLLMGA